MTSRIAVQRYLHVASSRKSVSLRLRRSLNQRAVVWKVAKDFKPMLKMDAPTQLEDTGIGLGRIGTIV